MTYKVEENDNISIVHLTGEIDMEVADKARQVILPLIKEGKIVQINLSKVDYMDSSGISVLIESKQLAEKNCAKFELTEVSKQVEKVLELSQFSLDRAIDAVYFMGLDGKFFYVNEDACQTLGYSQAKLLEMSVLDITNYISSQEEWRQHWQELKQSGSLRWEGTQKIRKVRLFQWRLAQIIWNLKIESTTVLSFEILGNAKK